MPFKKQDEESPWYEKECISREHDPPSHIVLPGGVHTWACPVCGQEQTVIVPTIRH